jgi:hypothetical protein
VTAFIPSFFHAFAPLPGLFSPLLIYPQMSDPLFPLLMLDRVFVILFSSKLSCPPILPEDSNSPILPLHFHLRSTYPLFGFPSPFTTCGKVGSGEEPANFSLGSLGPAIGSTFFFRSPRQLTLFPHPLVLSTLKFLAFCMHSKARKTWSTDTHEDLVPTSLKGIIHPCQYGEQIIARGPRLIRREQQENESENILFSPQSSLDARLLFY